MSGIKNMSQLISKLNSRLGNETYYLVLKRDSSEILQRRIAWHVKKVDPFQKLQRCNS